MPLLFIITFALGFLSMGFQLVGTRLLAPYYGSSILIWAVVISTFLTAFSLGSVVGGFLSGCSPLVKKRGCHVVIGTVALGLAQTGFLGRWWLGLLENSVPALLPGLVLACLILFLLPVGALAALPPLTIQEVSRRGLEPGLASGLVYGISTLGNISGVMVTAFFLIPGFPLSTLLSAWMLLSTVLSGILVTRLKV